MGLQTICFFSLFNFSFCQRDCGENDWKQIKIFSAGVSLSYHSSIELWCVFLFFSLCSSVRLSLFHFEIHLLSPVPCHISSTDLSVPPSPFYFIYFSSCNAPPPSLRRPSSCPPAVSHWQLFNLLPLFWWGLLTVSSQRVDCWGNQVFLFSFLWLWHWCKANAMKRGRTFPPECDVYSTLVENICMLIFVLLWTLVCTALCLCVLTRLNKVYNIKYICVLICPSRTIVDFKGLSHHFHIFIFHLWQNFPQNSVVL